MRRHARQWASILCWLVLVASAGEPVSAQVEVPRPPTRTVVFVCEHGAARSVLAAAYFNRLAAERHLDVRAIARGVAPQPELSAATVVGLKKDGVPFPDEAPRRLTEQDLRRAIRVIAFCPLPGSVANKARVGTFDVPAPGDGYDAARDAILVHVKRILDELAGGGRK